MGTIHISDNSLVKHKISQMRSTETDTKNFRRLVRQVSLLLAAEAMKDLPMENVSVTTPVTTAEVPMISGKMPAIVPILRAGLGMADGIIELVPSAKVGHIGLSRDEKTHLPHAYYAKMPGEIDKRLIIVPDPMLATGGSAVAAVEHIKANGGKFIRFICIIAAPEGLEALHTAHPDIDIYVGCLDKGLNENAYIVPGLGDAGDRIFGT